MTIHDQENPYTFRNVRLSSVCRTYKGLHTFYKSHQLKSHKI